MFYVPTYIPYSLSLFLQGSLCVSPSNSEACARFHEQSQFLPQQSAGMYLELSGFIHTYIDWVSQLYYIKLYWFCRSSASVTEVSLIEDLDRGLSWCKSIQNDRGKTSWEYFKLNHSSTIEWWQTLRYFVHSIPWSGVNWITSSQFGAVCPSHLDSNEPNKLLYPSLGTRFNSLVCKEQENPQGLNIPTKHSYQSSLQPPFHSGDTYQPIHLFNVYVSTKMKQSSSNGIEVRNTFRFFLSS